MKLVRGKPTEIKYDLYFPKIYDINVKKRLAFLRINRKRIIGFVVGGGSDTRFHLNRRWPIKNWVELAKLI